MDDTPLASMYSEHHRKGKKYRKSVLERERAHLFRAWIGQGKDFGLQGWHTVLSKKYFKNFS